MARTYENEETERLHQKTRGTPKHSTGMDKEPEMHEDEDGSEPEQIIEAHGPAHQTHIEKKGDSFSVHSHHGDGHKHVSHGHDLHSAHQHSMHMLSGEAPEQEPEPEAESMPEAEPSIPGM